MLVQGSRGSLLLVLAQFGLAAGSPVAAADSNALPVPAVTIYPGDIITEGSLIERDVPPNSGAVRGAAIENRAAIVGKIARRTLLPGAPIPWNAIAEPKLVLNGAKVRIIFEEDGLSIAAYGTALQSGALGDVVSVRNLESGITVSGKVQPDGSVRVNGS